VRSEHANYDRRALIIRRYTVATVKTAQTDRTLSVYALPQNRFNIKGNFRFQNSKTKKMQAFPSK